MWTLLGKFGKLLLLAGVCFLGIVTAVKSHNDTPLPTTTPVTDPETVGPKPQLLPSKQSGDYKYPRTSATQLGRLFTDMELSIVEGDRTISQFEINPNVIELANFLNAGSEFDQYNHKQEGKILTLEDRQRLDKLWDTVIRKIVKLLVPTLLERNYASLLERDYSSLAGSSLGHPYYKGKHALEHVWDQVLNVRVPAVVRALKTGGYASMNIGGTAHKNSWLQRLNDSLNTKPMPITVCSMYPLRPTRGSVGSRTERHAFRVRIRSENNEKLIKFLDVVNKLAEEDVRLYEQAGKSPEDYNQDWESMMVFLGEATRGNWASLQIYRKYFFVRTTIETIQAQGIVSAKEVLKQLQKRIRIQIY